MTIHLVHGFNVSNGGSSTTDRLIPFLEKAGYEVKEQDYGYFWLFKVRLKNDNVARDITKDIKPGDIGIGHSNGCEILCDAADYGAPFKGLVLINPALDADRTVKNSKIEWVHVYYNPSDYAVWWSKWLLFHPWGEMGKVGYWGHDKRYKSFNCSKYGVHGHSAFFDVDKVEGMAARLIENMEDEDVGGN